MSHPTVQVRVENFGVLAVTPTSRDHLYVECDPCIIRGKAVRFTMHWTKRHGGWNHLWDGGSSSLYAGGGNSATKAQRERILAISTPALALWMESEEGQSYLDQAQTAHVNERLEKLEERKADLRAEIAKLDKEMEELKGNR